MGIRLRKLGIKISKYLALMLLILTNTPFAYANDIKKAIEQSKSESYYKATVNELKDAVIPETPNRDPKKENKASGDQVNTEEKQKAKHAIRLPEVSETKTSQPRLDLLSNDYFRLSQEDKYLNFFENVFYLNEEKVYVDFVYFSDEKKFYNL